MCDILTAFVGCILSLTSWAAPQPQYSAGRIYNYGGESVVAANAAWRGYDLEGYAGGGASISPVMLGRIMWARAEHGEWIGPLLVVDVVARRDAYGSIFERGEIAELPRGILAQLGGAYGVDGYVWFGICPPPADALFPAPMQYRPPLVMVPVGGPHLSFYPYPDQQRPVVCPQ